MNCPNCGAKIVNGKLYCGKCGNEIHIVPDFEAELEENLSASISNLAEEISRTSDKPQTEKKRIKKAGILITSLLLSILLTGGICFTLKYIRYHSFEYQMEKGKEFFLKGSYEKADGYYRRARELNKEDPEVALILAEICMINGAIDEYEFYLTEVIANKASTQEQLETAYSKMVGLFVEREEYTGINELLSRCKNEKIKASYQKYMATAPVFNYETGNYEKAIPLKLTTDSVGRIYYTMDGSDPDRNSHLYTAPILLEEGSIVLKAILINEYGVESEIVEKRYQINVTEELVPEISAISGKYHNPTLIRVENAYGRDVYYTTDGTKPTLISQLYTEPIPMPLGESIFCFAFFDEDGICGKVEERKYTLELNTELSTEDAEELVVEYMLISKKILLENGIISHESSAKYLYEYQYVTEISGSGTFYVVSEIYSDEEGILAKTGVLYAVNIKTGKCFELKKDGNNNCTLVEILNE